MHWIRIVLGALLLEVVLFATLVPLGEVMGSPFAFDPAKRTSDATPYFIAVAVGCFVFSYLVASWVLRKVAFKRVLHGALIGVLATAMYIALAAAQPDGLSSVIAGYGMTYFVLMNILRIGGCVVGAAHRPRAATV